jgi:HEAT repeat protein
LPPDDAVILALHGPSPRWALNEIFKRTSIQPAWGYLFANQGAFQRSQWQACASASATLRQGEHNLDILIDAMGLLNIARDSIDIETKLVECYQSLEAPLINEDSTVRTVATLHAARDADPQRAIARLRQRLDDPDTSVQVAAVLGLKRIASPDVSFAHTEEILIALRSIRLPPAGPFSLPEAHANTVLEQQVCEILRPVATKWPRVGARAAAVLAIAKFRMNEPETIQFIAIATDDESPLVRAAGFHAASSQPWNHESASVVARAVEDLSFTHADLRRGAAEYLSKLAAKHLVPFEDDLHSMSYASDDAHVRQTAREILRKLYSIMPDERNN